MPRPDVDRIINRLYQPRLQPRDFFYHADDRFLQSATGGAFPAKVKTDHPVFVSAVSLDEARISPCTSYDGEVNQQYRSINRGCLKRNSKDGFMVPEQTTYIVEDKSFGGSLDRMFWESLNLTYHGQVPEDAINENARPKGALWKY